METSTITANPVRESRRRAFGTGAVALALSAVAGSARAAETRPIMRARFGITADWTPVHNNVSVIPWTQSLYNEGVACSLEPDGYFLINAPGLYRISLSVDWVAQQSTDIDLRKIGIRRKRAGVPKLIGVRLADRDDDRLASVDTPGSNPPRMARHQATWSPGFIAAGASSMATFTVAPPNVVVPGDLAFASHALLSDAGIGAVACDALTVQAKVVAKDTVRVAIHNPSMAAGVTVPEGALNIVAMSSTLTCGESADAWQVLHTPTEQLLAGERIYAVVRPCAPGDYVQATKSCYIQIEKLD